MFTQHSDYICHRTDGYYSHTFKYNLHTKVFSTQAVISSQTLTQPPDFCKGFVSLIKIPLQIVRDQDSADKRNQNTCKRPLRELKSSGKSLKALGENI